MTIIARSLLRRLLTPLATVRSASMSRPESVSSRMASLGSSTAIWKISLRFFSPPEKPSLTERPVKLWSMATSFIFSLASARKSIASSSSSPRRLRSALSAVRGREREQVLALVEDLALGHLERLVPGEDLREGALARPVGAHDGVHLARPDLEIDAAEDLLAADVGVQVLHAQHGLRPRHPMLPSRLTLRSFCASTANSIGSSLNTSRQKPFTIIETASSAEMPRCVQ